jgi:hypothetical protein
MLICKLQAKEKDDYKENTDTQDGYAPSGIALGLEFALVGDEVALGELHFG